MMRFTFSSFVAGSHGPTRSIEGDSCSVATPGEPFDGPGAPPGYICS
jgi:hypothetical protein